MEVYSKYRKKRAGKKGGTFPSRRVGIVILILTTILLVLLKVATWLNAQELFLLKEITVEGNRLLEKSEILNLVQMDSVENLLEFDVQNISEQIKQHPLIHQVWVSRRLPSTLVIEVREKHPLAILNDSQLLAIDDKGNAMPVFRTEMLFDIPIISNLNLSENKKELKHVLNFLNFTKSRYFTLYCEISEISYSKNLGVYFYLTDRAIPVICGEGDLENKGKNFLNVLTILKREGKLQTVKYFDLRFKDQVIVN